MASRSIDLAPTASIDLMTLNNKVVNMRQVVKRTKVQVINKLCKHISALKKKKGTDEQKTKNLRKAERFIEEIDSIKKLKEDKVSKYALANTVSFMDVSKMSLLAGPRALARLAEHPLMKKVVSDFRQQHHDWRDLAAFLLVKQTGRRFKTKKQKQKKLSRCVENINASETMTKAYIQERFGKEGLTKAEQRFERKRKRPKSVTKLDTQDTDEGDSEEKRPRTASDTNVESDQSLANAQLQTESSSSKKENEDSNKPVMFSDGNSEVAKAKDVPEVKHVTTPLEQEANSDAEESNDSDSDESDNVSTENQKSPLNKTKVLGKGDDSDVSDSESSDSESQISDVKKMPRANLKIGVGDTEKISTSKRNECVVRELKMEVDGEEDGSEVSNSDSASASESDSDSDNDSENKDNAIQESFDENDDGEELNDKKEGDPKVSKRSLKKKKQTPEFLTRANKTAVSDPFFAGSDDDDDEGTFEDSGVNEELDDNEDYMSDNDLSSEKSKVESMFYTPHFSAKNERVKSSRYERDGSRGHFNRRGGFETSGSSYRGRGMTRGRGGRGNFRGRGGDFSDRARGSKFGGSGRGWSKHQDGDNEGRRFRHRDSSPQSSFEKRFDDRQDSHQKKSFGAFGNKGAAMDKGSNMDKGPQEKLHPSWEASKKRKAEQSGIVAFKGSKITFDDD